MALAIYGIGGSGRDTAETARRQLLHDRADLDIVFVDDAPDAPAEVSGFPVLNFEALRTAHAHRQVVVAISDGRVRQRLEQKCLDAGLSLGTVVAPSAILPVGLTLPPGSIISDYCIVTVDVMIGRSFQCNMHAYVAHDCVIGDYVTFAPRVCCNGNVHIGNHAYIGTGAMIRQGTTAAPLVIGEGATVGMGAVVTRPVEPGVTVVGNPARPMRR